VKIDAGRTIGFLNILGEIEFLLTLNCVLFCETNYSNRLLGATRAICLILLSLLPWKQNQNIIHLGTLYFTLTIQFADCLGIPRVSKF
jgi:hypothetical protein